MMRWRLLQQLLNDENRDAGSSNTCKMKLLQRLMSSSDFSGSLSMSLVRWWTTFFDHYLLYVVKIDGPVEGALWLVFSLHLQGDVCLLSFFPDNTPPPPSPVTDGKHSWAVSLYILTANNLSKQRVGMYNGSGATGTVQVLYITYAAYTYSELITSHMVG